MFDADVVTLLPSESCLSRLQVNLLSQSHAFAAALTCRAPPAPRRRSARAYPPRFCLLHGAWLKLHPPRAPTAHETIAGPSSTDEARASLGSTPGCRPLSSSIAPLAHTGLAASIRIFCSEFLRCPCGTVVSRARIPRVLAEFLEIDSSFSHTLPHLHQPDSTVAPSPIVSPRHR